MIRFVGQPAKHVLLKDVMIHERFCEYVGRYIMNNELDYRYWSCCFASSIGLREWKDYVGRYQTPT